MPSLAELADVEYMDELSKIERAAIMWKWKFWARPEQLEPPGDWSVWLALAGRGFGKTRLGAEWCRAQMCGPTPLSRGKFERLALVAETAADGRDVMVQGPSGLLAVHPKAFRPRYVKSDRALYWPNGAKALLFSAEDPEQLRGPEHDGAWSDELGKWRYATETWDMLQFGLRSGSDPRQLVTTTPRPIQTLKDLLAGEATGETKVTRGSTYDNAPNLAPKFLARIRSKYEGTRLGRQELHAEVLGDLPGALWTRLMLEQRGSASPLGAGMHQDETLPEMVRVVVAVDPSGTHGRRQKVKESAILEDEGGDDIGVVAAGKGTDGYYYVLADETCNLGPAGWARVAVNTYRDRKADLIVAEVNYGGAMVENTIRMVDREVSYKEVTATRGKVVRAEPIAALYEQGRVRHRGTFAALEDEMVNFTRSGYVGSRSPNRADALVWALTELAGGDPEYDLEMWLKLAE